MNTKINAILIHKDDNVITATEELKAGSIARYQSEDQTTEVKVIEEIPKYHKIALVDIQQSGPVYKYGQLIGKAIKTISKGSHVHDHNIAGLRG